MIFHSLHFWSKVFFKNLEHCISVAVTFDTKIPGYDVFEIIFMTFKFKLRSFKSYKGMATRQIDQF